MFDGFGLDHLAQSEMPTLRRWQREGLYKSVKGVMPSVTRLTGAAPRNQSASLSEPQGCIVDQVTSPLG